MKICSRCKELKPSSSYTRSNNRGSGGLGRYCKECRRQYRIANIARTREAARIWRQKNREKYRAHKAIYRSKPDVKVRRRKIRSGPDGYEKRKRNSDVCYKLRSTLRGRLRSALKNNQKKGKTLDYLGCTVKELKEHLESQFKSGMTWNNWKHKGWHIDHIIPFTEFDLTNEQEIKKVCNYKNLQPLWAEDNWSKQAKTSLGSQDIKNITA